MKFSKIILIALAVLALGFSAHLQDIDSKTKSLIEGERFGEHLKTIENGLQSD
ncbi:MAG: hypothetical protein R3B47_10705 [Bacteroidia bacterium]